MTVYLVGAGPGDPGLMTARSLELIAQADVIVYDRLIPANALHGARADARLIYAGKEGGGEQIPQAEIERLLLEHGASGATVVRLKGGDPFVFGRGGEEAETLRAAGIEFEVVPGVTSGIAAPAYAGVPVTHREAASAVAFLTGHEDPAKPDSALDWQALAAFPGTLVVYMGVRQLPAITAKLIEGGRSRTSLPRWSTAAPCPDSGPRSGRSPRLPRWPWPSASRRRRSRSSARWRPCGSGWPGSSGARSAVARSRSRAPARRPADWRRHCARSGLMWWRRR